MPTLHLGINTCFAVKRWPEPERWVSIVKRYLGLTCCQFSLDLVDPSLDEKATASYADEVRACSTANNLHLHSTFTGLAAYSWSQLLHPNKALREVAMSWYTRAIDFTERLGAYGTGGHIGAFSAQDDVDGPRKRALVQEMTERLAALSRYAAQKGLRFLLFENMAVEREWGHTIQEAQLLANLETGTGVPLVLCLDVGHPCVLRTGTSSDEYLAWLSQSWPHTPIIHLQQTDRSADHHWPFTAEYNRRGIVQAGPVIEAIQHWSNCSDVYLFLEPIFPFEADDATVLHGLRESVRYWQEAMQKQ